jgi:hypothetical protein
VAVKNGYVRKCVLIDKDFQFRYMVTWIGMTMTLLAGMVLASVSMIYLFRIQTFNTLVMVNTGCAILITVLSMRYMIHASHRIAGPAYRLERVIRDVADGTFEGYLTLRRKDYLKHVADSVNHLIDRMKERSEEVHGVHRRALELERALAQEPGTPAEVRELASWMVEKLGEIANQYPSGEGVGAEEVTYLSREAQSVEVGM